MEPGLAGVGVVWEEQRLCATSGSEGTSSGLLVFGDAASERDRPIESMLSVVGREI